MVTWLFFASVGWLLCALLLRGEAALVARLARRRRIRTARYRHA